MLFFLYVSPSMATPLAEYKTPASTPNPKTGAMNFAIGPAYQPVCPSLIPFMSLGASGRLTPPFMPQSNCAVAGTAIERLKANSITVIFFIISFILFIKQKRYCHRYDNIVSIPYSLQMNNKISM